MKIAGIVISAFSNNFKQGDVSIKKVFHELQIPLVEEVKTINDDFLLSVAKKYQDYQAVAIGFDDSEFYSLPENKRLLNNFINYQVDIGFGENYPQGVVMEIVNLEIFPIIDNLRKQNKLAFTRSFFQDIINIDVNLFDLENLYTEVNLRTLRLDFFSCNIQNQFLINKIKNFLPANTDLVTSNFSDLANGIIDNRKELRTIPKFFEISLTNKVVQPYLYYPFQKENQSQENFLSLENYKIILDKIIRFSPEVIISFNGFGEMTSNPEWKDIVQHTLRKNVTCILETTGVFWDNSLSDSIQGWDNYKKLTVIFTVDTLNEKLYGDLRGNDYPLSAILEKIEYYLLRYGDNVYLQAVKTNETFPFLNDFYEYFKKFTKNIIISKYNIYRGHLLERRTNPMQPFEKIDCWHLKRDMKINENGDVWVCKQDINQENVLGNLLKDDIQAIFNQGQAYFEKHLNGWDFCQNCDENYTYNF